MDWLGIIYSTSFCFSEVDTGRGLCPLTGLLDSLTVGGVVALSGVRDAPMRVLKAESKKFLSSRCGNFKETTRGSSGLAGPDPTDCERTIIVSASGGCFILLSL